MGLFDKLMGRDLPERRDARGIYFRLLEQSRDPAFFGAGKVADDYDGRISLITLHYAVMMRRLNREGRDGEILRQAIFDEMKDDFEVALREEGIADTGVKRRIKPMIALFYERLKAFNEAMDSEEPQRALAEALQNDEDATADAFDARLADYALDLEKSLAETSLKDIIAKRFYFPDTAGFR